jgi:uncharacterized protein YqeY
MTLQEQIAVDLQQAQKGGAKARVSVLRLVRAGAKNAEIAKGAPLEDAAIIDIIAREVRRHRESIAGFTKGNRQDLVDQEEAELAVLMEYLPKQMSREEVVAAARQVMEQVGASGPSDKGKVMSQLMPQLKGKADGREVSDVVAELLTG